MAPIEIRAADAAKGAAMHWTTGLALGLPTLLVVLVGAWLFMWNVRYVKSRPIFGDVFGDVFEDVPCASKIVLIRVL
jgi:hypothetical protein